MQKPTMLRVFAYEMYILMHVLIESTEHITKVMTQKKNGETFSATGVNEYVTGRVFPVVE